MKNMDSSTREAASAYDFKWSFYHNYFSIATQWPVVLIFSFCSVYCIYPPPPFICQHPSLDPYR